LIFLSVHTVPFWRLMFYLESQTFQKVKKWTAADVMYSLYTLFTHSKSKIQLFNPCTGALLIEMGTCTCTVGISNLCELYTVKCIRLFGRQNNLIMEFLI
jgi:hypothetical protein